MIEKFDLIVFGAGLFGSHTALHFSRKGKRVLLIEREERDAAWAKASLVNQARVHSGHHYPRSIKTALMALDHRERFIREHLDIINAQFKAYYAIDRYGSLTDAQQFARFCRKVGIQHRQVERSDLFSRDRIEALFEADEFSFDPLLLRKRYTSALSESSVTIEFGTKLLAAGKTGNTWSMSLQSRDGTKKCLETPSVINATYAAINSINAVFGVPAIGATHELSEIVLVHIPSLTDVGLTVMDGPFVSVMPFGVSGLHSLSSVLYTHRAYCSAGAPSFPCQQERDDCHPSAVAVCSRCPVKPSTNARKMVRQLGHYLNHPNQIYVHGCLHTVKTKLKSALADDGRPTDIRIHSQSPFFASVFSGKVNSVYEVERIEISD